MLLVSLTANLSVANAQSNEQIESYERRFDEQQLQLDAMREELEALKQRARMSSVSLDEPELLEVPEQDAGAGRDYEPFVVRRSQNGVLSLGGRLSRLMMQVDDGASTNGFFMDSAQAPTMLRADISTQANNDWTWSGALEVGIQSNSASQVSQDNPNPGTDITVRDAEVILDGTRFG